MQEEVNKQSNFKGFLIWAKSHCLLAVTPLIICLIAALAYMTLTTKQYIQSTAFTLKFAPNGTAMTRDIMLFNEISFVKRQTSFDNEKEFFGSISMAEEIVKMVNMQNEIYADLGLTTKLLYNDAPISFSIKSDESCQTFTADAFPSEKNITLKNIRFNGQNYKKELTTTYGKPIMTSCGTITINRTEEKSNFDKLILKYRNQSIAAEEVSKNLKFYTATMFATVLNFNYTDKSPERAKDIVTKLPKAYNNLWHEYIVSITKESEEFIDRQLKQVERDLKFLETDIANISESNKLLIPQIENIQTAKKQTLIKGETIASETSLFVARNTLNHIKSTGDSLSLIPLNTIDGNKLINLSITDYNTRIIQLRKIINSGEKNPTKTVLEKNARELKKTIIKSLESHIATSVKKLAELQKERLNVENSISKSSKTELLKASRLRKIDMLQKTYIYLKQKQEECSMAMDINLNAVRIIRNASIESKIVSPNMPSALFLALLFGLILIPYAIYLTSDAFNTKILFVKELANFSILGRIPALSKYGSIERETKFYKQILEPKIFVEKESTNKINDAFRIIRTNIDFILPKANDGRIIGVASVGNPMLSATIALNMAIAASLKTPKTLLVDFDLRHSPLAISSKGMSNVLNNEIAVKNAIDSRLFNGLNFIAAGQEAPNALELIATQIKNAELENLKKEYDYIFINLPPIERFTDAKIIAQNCDLTNLVIESNTLEVEYIKKIKEAASSNEYPRLTLTLCGFKK